MTDIGFVGLGVMGKRIARRLVDNGHRLTVYDVQAAATAEFATLGAMVANSPAEVADKSGTVFVCLPTPPVVREVALGPSGLSEGRLSTYVDFSTTGPQTSVAVAAALEEKGVEVLDTPMGGGAAGAESGTLTLMISGSESAYRRLEAVFEVLSKKRFFVGDRPGQGQMLKLLNNFLSVTALTATSEAMVLGVKFGLKPETILDVLNASPARNNATDTKFPKNILPGTFDHGFATQLMHKDIRLCMEEADALGIPMWIGSAIKQVWAYAMTQDGADADTTEIVKHYERWAGVEVRATTLSGSVRPNRLEPGSGDP